MNVKRQKARAFGLALEWRAALWLMLKGHRILARNFRISGGEIDIVTLSPERWVGGGFLCFVEVRGRSDAMAAHDSVDSAKQFRIRAAARAYRAMNPGLARYPARFDIVAAGRNGALVHNRNAFDA